ncbi:TetR family transcriptional regulator [Cupriavidus basilensis]
MADLAAACGASKALLCHYYESKEAILFDLLDTSYARRLMLIVTEVEADSERQRRTPTAKASASLIRAFLAEYENSQTRHVALIS